MDFYTDLASMYLEMGLTFLAFAFVVASIVLFIVDGVKASKEKRKRKKWIMVMFIIAMILNAVFIAGVIFVAVCLLMYMFGAG